MKKLFLVCSIITFFVINIIGTVQALPINVALNGTASQSSITQYPYATADKVIDGNIDGNFWNESVNHTQRESHAWWEVDLGQAYSIDKIDIYNRTDGGQSISNRLVPFNVIILNSYHNTIWAQTTHNLPSNEYDPLEYFPINIVGQYVKVCLINTDYLHIAEVQVWSDDGGISSVPEPATMILLGTCLAGLGILKRRK